MIHRVEMNKKGLVRCSCGSEFKDMDEWIAHKEGADDSTKSKSH